MSRSTSITLALLAAAMLAGCSNDNSSPTAATPPTAINDVFSGTLTLNGATTYPFAVQQTGTVTVSVTTVSDPAAIIGVSLGTWNSNASCQIIITNDRAVQGTAVIGTAANAGNFCVRVADATGALAAPVDYQITVNHF